MPLIPLRPRKTPRQAAQSQTHKFAMFPPPVGGLDLSQPLMMQDPRTALILDNVFVREFGSELRPGSLRWATRLGVVSGKPSEVVSLMAYHPPPGAGVSSARLFAAPTNGRVYDVTAGDVNNPPHIVTFPSQVRPGQLSWTNYTTQATSYLCVCGAGGGYWTYDTIGGWIRRTDEILFGDPLVSGVASGFDFIMAWKNRLWFILDGSSKAYYLPAGAITGEVREFDFGQLFVHGGQLEALASWTVDGGDGLDDKLVLVATGGDVLIYEGTDPNSISTFRIVGRWHMGRPPYGRRFMSKYGGDLILLTEKGIEYMSRLLQGQGSLDPESQPQTVARKYNDVIGSDIRNTRGQRFWEPVHLVGEESVIITTPHNKVEANGIQFGRQYVFNSLSQGWSRFTGMAMNCAEEFLGDLYFGTKDGKVCKAFNGPSDDFLDKNHPGQSYFADLQTAFVAPENDKMGLKIPQLVCPMFTSSFQPSFTLRINTEWNFRPVNATPYFIPEDITTWQGGILVPPPKFVPGSPPLGDAIWEPQVLAPLTTLWEETPSVPPASGWVSGILNPTDLNAVISVDPPIGTGIWQPASPPAHQSKWMGAVNTYMAWVGVEGLGTHASLRIKFSGQPRTVFTGWKYIYGPGGVM